MEQFSPTRLARFWASFEMTNGCWLWRGPIGSATGYGSLGNFAAHRYSYELHVGPIPNGMQIDHLCRVRACVNPEHLEVVTPRENYLRGVSLPAQNARKTHCKWGHAFTPENTYRDKGGWRQCVECRRLSWYRRPPEKRRRPSKAGQNQLWWYHKMPVEERRAYWRAAERRKAQRRKGS